MQQQFVVSHNGFEVGPLKAAEIILKLSKKEFQPVDYVFVEEKNDWIMLAEFQAYLDANEPKSASLPEQPPVLSPYPVLTDAKKEKLLNETAEARAAATPPPIQNSKAAKTESGATSNLSESIELKIPKQPFQPDQEKLKTIEIQNLKPVTSSSENKSSTSIQLKQGEGLYSIPAEKAGQFTVQLKSKSTLSVGSQLEVNVKSGKPDKLTWEGPTRKIVGQAAVFQVFAKDQYDNLVKSYSGELSLKWQGDVQAPAKVKFKLGVGEIEVTTTKAQTLGFEILTSSEFPDIKLPSPAQIQFEAGPAEKLILDGPTEVMAGEPVQVKVRALDKYGNIAKLDDEVEVEVTTRTGS